MTVWARTTELVGAGVPPVDALWMALRPPRHLIRDDGSLRRPKGPGTEVSLVRWHPGVPGWVGMEQRPENVGLARCGWCGYPDSAVELGLFLKGSWVPCRECGGVLTHHSTYF